LSSILGEPPVIEDGGACDWRPFRRRALGGAEAQAGRRRPGLRRAGSPVCARSGG